MLAQRLVSEATAEALLHDLVATPSPSWQEAAASNLLVNWMRANGYDSAYVDEAGSAVGIIGSGPRTLMMLGHIDTFSGNPPVRIENGMLYGRGAVDAKGALCTFAVAAAQAVIPADLRVIVVGAVEEECPTSRGARHVAAAFQPDMCIIGEPSQWDRLTLGYKGRLVLHWSWNGGLAHSAGQAATPGEHAISYWQQVQVYVQAFNEGRTRIFEQLDATLQEINTSSDGIYGTARMTIGFRLPPGLHPDALQAALPSADGAVMEAVGKEVAFLADKDTLLSRVMRGAIREVGGTPAFVHKTGTSDMNIVGPEWGCPILAYGPGDSALDHTPDEHLPLTDYHRAVRVLASAIARL